VNIVNPMQQLSKRLGLRLWCLKTGRGWKWGEGVSAKNADAGVYHVKFDDEKEGNFTGDKPASPAF
jgi:hypothetical protein